MSKILIINGPNLNMLGIREKSIYGEESLDTINQDLRNLAQKTGVELEFYQSNHEGDLVDEIQKAYKRINFIIINPGALSHYSIAVLDALKSVNIPFIEVHLSNIYRREAFRQHSLISAAAVGGVFGLGAYGYKLALLAACDILTQKSS
ncbi:MAG: type II 3-dehydroquinate dehydratase [Syntrophomonas sp.]